MFFNQSQRLIIALLMCALSNGEIERTDEDNCVWNSDYRTCLCTGPIGRPNYICNPIVHFMKCCGGNTTCEYIKGLDDYMCRPNNNTCRAVEDCGIGSFMVFECLPEGKCGMCRATGWSCDAVKCCGYCNPNNNGCADSPLPQPKKFVEFKIGIIDQMYYNTSNLISSTLTWFLCLIFHIIKYYYVQ
jgi:hypothetical protein